MTPTSNGQPPHLRQDVADEFAQLSLRLRRPEQELTDGEWEKLDQNFHLMAQDHVRHMHASARVLVGWLWLPMVGFLSLIGLLWSYPHAERAWEAETTTVSIPVNWWGPDFTVSRMTGTLLTLAFAAIAGCIVQGCIVFSMRAGKRTLERGYEAWYVLRSFASALLAVLTGLAVNAGLVVLTPDATGTPSPSLPTMVAIGALAGLFTDKVLQRMQKILGATDPDRPASRQTTPDASDTQAQQKPAAEKQAPGTEGTRVSFRI